MNTGTAVRENSQRGQTVTFVAVALTVLTGLLVLRLILDRSLPSARLPDTPWHAILFYSAFLGITAGPVLNIVGLVLGIVGWVRGAYPKLSVAAIVLNAPMVPLSCFWLFLFTQALLAHA